MKILVLTLHADPTIHPGSLEGGGTHLYVNEIIRILIYKRIKSVVITRKASKGREIFDFGDTKIIRLKIGPEEQWNKNNLEQIEKVINKNILSILNKYNFTPELIHSIYWYSGRSALKLSQYYKIPFIYTVISNGKRKKSAGYKVSKTRIRVENIIFQKASIIISVSKQEKNDLINLYGVEPNKIKVIGRGVDNIFIKNLFDRNGSLLAKSQLDIPTVNF